MKQVMWYCSSRASPLNLRWTYENHQPLAMSMLLLPLYNVRGVARIFLNIKKKTFQQKYAASCYLLFRRSSHLMFAGILATPLIWLCSISYIFITKCWWVSQAEFPFTSLRVLQLLQFYSFQNIVICRWYTDDYDPDFG